MRVRVTAHGLGSGDHHCLSGRDAGYGFRDRVSRDLSIFARFSPFFAIFDDVGLSGREISVPRLQTVSGVTDFVHLQSSESRRNRLSISLRVSVRVDVFR